MHRVFTIRLVSPPREKASFYFAHTPIFQILPMSPPNEHPSPPNEHSTSPSERPSPSDELPTPSDELPPPPTVGPVPHDTPSSASSPADHRELSPLPDQSSPLNLAWGWIGDVAQYIRDVLATALMCLRVSLTDIVVTALMYLKLPLAVLLAAVICGFAAARPLSRRSAGPRGQDTGRARAGPEGAGPERVAPSDRM